ncbi:hypothetical protein [Marinobacter sp. W-8]|uniref:hypothetical protein n=1 Tax=Marinobacter sp. W-8 TaxID=3369658 RepID=UPI0037CA82E0
MKYKISKDEFEKLSEELQAIYTADGDDFVLVVEDMPKPETKQDDSKAKQLAQQLQDLQTKYDTLVSEQAQKEEQKAQDNGDFESLYKSSEQDREQLKQRIKEMESERANEKREAAISKLVSDNKIIDEFKPLISRHFSDRVMYKDGKLVVTDTDGNPTVSTLDDLVAEAKTQYPSMFAGSGATGGGALGGDSKTVHKKLDEYSREERAKLPVEELERLTKEYEESLQDK